MRTKFRSPRLLLSLALVVVAVTVVAAQTVANGPYYALPSWSQKLPANTRFIVLANWNNEAVLDRETGLVWERSPDPQPVPRFFARGQCVDKNVGGRMGWRLPSQFELLTLVDRSVPEPGPLLPNGHSFANVQSSPYWSATGSPVPDLLWVVDFGGLVSADVVAFRAGDGPQYPTWCVRGPTTAEVY